MITTFADSFVPRQMQGVGSPSALMGGYGSLAIGGNGNMIPSGAQINRPRDQVQHYRLWNYVAVSRNAWAACKATPNVSVMRRGGARTSAQQLQWLTKPQRQFLREQYSGLLTGARDDLEPLADDHPLSSLLKNPNGSDWWNSFSNETFMFWGLTGAFYWWVVPNGFGVPAELYVIPTQWVDKVYAKSGDLMYYRVTGNGHQIDLPPDQVIEALSKNPFDKTRPTAPISAGAEWVINGEHIEKARQLTLQQGPYPSVVLTFDPELYGNTTPDENLITRVGEKFISRYGGPANAGKPITMPPGVNAVPWSMKPQEMDFPNTGADVRDNVLALHGTPRAIAGLSHDLNRASIDGAHLIHCENVIMPLHCWTAGVITHKLAKRFDEKIVVWFDDVRPRNDEQELAETNLDWQMGAISPDERRQDRGREPLPGKAGNKTFVAVGLTPLEDFDGDAEERAEAAQPVADEQDDQDSDDQSQSLWCPVHGWGVSGEAVTFSEKTHGRMSAIARQFVSIHQAHERAAASAVRRMWTVVSQRAIELFDRHKTDASHPSAKELVSQGDFRPVFNRFMTPIWMQCATAGAKFEESNHGKKQQAAKEVKLPPLIQRGVSEFLKSRLGGVWSQVLETTQTLLADSLDEGITEGESPAKIRRRVQKVLDNRRDDAETIARTEVTGALSRGQQLYRESEGIDRKVWIDTIDRKTRSTHVIAGGQIVANNEPFEIGGQKMMHPGDGTLGATADEIVNCRCCATGYIE